VGDPEGRGRAALAHSGLQDPQPAVLDGELHVAQVAVVLFQDGQVAEQLRVDGRLVVRHVRQRGRRATAVDDVLALGVLEVVTIGAGGARRRVAGEADAAAGAWAGVPIDHGHDVDRGAQVVRDLLVCAVDPGARAVPRVEDRDNCAVELGSRILREILA
jgi:hypothetical protein